MFLQYGFLYLILTRPKFEVHSRIWGTAGLEMEVLAAAAVKWSVSVRAGDAMGQQGMGGGSQQWRRRNRLVFHVITAE